MTVIKVALLSLACALVGSVLGVGIVYLGLTLTI